MTTHSMGTGARWSMVVISLGATLCAFTFINGVAFLIPALQVERGSTLAQAGLLSSMPSFGMVVTLIGWGYLVDRIGERIVLTASSALTAVGAYSAASVHSLVVVGAFLFFGGMAAAGCNSASGRLVTGWFPPHQRGLAMGVRQAAQPLGIALGAAVMPELAERGLSAALMFPALVCTVSAAACAIGIVDPPRKTRAAATDEELTNPYRESTLLWRIHAVSALLMVPQAVTATFMLAWLMRDQKWTVGAAGALVTLTQLLGALARVLVGRWSDRVASRLRPLRTLAGLAALAMFVLAINDHFGSPFAEAAMVVAAVLAVTDNGLAATAIPEYAGPFWSGRALGTQNTGQRLAAAAAAPLFGALVTATAYPVGFAVCGLTALVAVPLVPVSAEKSTRKKPPRPAPRPARRSGRRLGVSKAARRPG
ncbi:MFS transporter [Mycobacterium sp.]|uniref:MFS transporter n=1 Tax=Mycobacterium sp. TaxID=1785 RepID=UPI00127E6D72|nr:MFS transporter [Mycobacterium sp.]KAA8967734.1 MAG: MFS transporter [Mycobacterium sp.]